MIPVGLRIDVDTLRGTRIGVPNLLTLLARHHIRASFFFSVGPDNMGRHLLRLMRPAFLLKMIRTGAPRLYGWDILMRGTLWPGPVIGRCCPGPMQAAAGAGHETGLHAWDHHRWQQRVERMDQSALDREIRRGFDLLAGILGKIPDGFAAPAWRVTPQALQALDRFSFRFQSDCRGSTPFRPTVAGESLRHVQIPVTLPTYDEIVGRRCTSETYNDCLLDMIGPQGLNVLTIHAEVEGIGCLPLFRDFLEKSRRRDIVFKPLGTLLKAYRKIVAAGVQKTVVAGREGWLACQEGVAG